MIDAFMAAVTARSSRPYSPVSSVDAHDGRPRLGGQRRRPASRWSRRRARTPRPTPIALDAAARAAAASGRGRRRGSRPSVTSRKPGTVARRLPGAARPSASCGALAAPCASSGRRPMPTTPTVPTSPSSRALTAWVVEWVTSSTWSAPTFAGDLGHALAPRRRRRRRRRDGWSGSTAWATTRRREVEGHGLGERPADVDPDAHAHQRGSGGRRRARPADGLGRWRDGARRAGARGFTTNT